MIMYKARNEFKGSITRMIILISIKVWLTKKWTSKCTVAGRFGHRSGEHPTRSRDAYGESENKYITARINKKWREQIKKICRASVGRMLIACDLFGTKLKL